MPIVFRIPPVLQTTRSDDPANANTATRQYYLQPVCQGDPQTVTDGVYKPDLS
jgi:hypothetical protein